MTETILSQNVIQSYAQHLRQEEKSDAFAPLYWNSIVSPPPSVILVPYFFKALKISVFAFFCAGVSCAAFIATQPITAAIMIKKIFFIFSFNLFVTF